MTKIINVFIGLASHFFKTKIVIYKPCTKCISRYANISVTRKFIFNTHWTRQATIGNQQAGCILIMKGARLDVGHFLFYAGSKIEIRENAQLILGSGYMNYGASIECHKKITIGENVSIAEGVVIRDSDNHTISRKSYCSTSEIVIGDHVWIGTKAVILKGVKIGDGSIIAAGSIVTKDIPEKSLAAGVPAKVIKSNIDWQ